MTAENILKAKGLANLGIYVFPVYVTPDKNNPYKTTKRPATGKGFYDSTIDPFYVEDLFEKHPKAQVGVWMGASGLIAGDVDVKRAPDGTILVDGWENVTLEGYDFPPTFEFNSISDSGGVQFIYKAPETDEPIGPKTDYRGVQGLDRRSGDSFSVWAGGVPKSRAEFSDAPEWLLDRTTARIVESFEGSLKEWYDSLEVGEPGVVVRAAIQRAEELFRDNGDDFNHGDLVERQYEAVRLGAEGYTGVPVLLEKLEDLFMSRTGEHSRDESQWEYEFQEALLSGIAKYGDAIELRKSLPEYSISKIPPSVPDNLIVGTPGDKEVFRRLMRSLQDATSDDLLVTSVLWNSPRTKDISREWGLEFVHKRVVDSRENPEPDKPNPSLTKPEVTKVALGENEFLSAEELETVQSTPTFVDTYRAGTQLKGFANETYVPPCALTALSMAFGYRAYLPLSKVFEVNLWLIVLGESTTGKGTEDRFLRGILNLMFLDGESENYNLGAMSSPDGLQLGLILRDKKPSIIHNDEAADFFRDIRNKDWMAPVPDKLAKWYDGFVEPSSKISLKDARGKAAHTSLNQLMWGTPERLLSLMDASMFASGYLARVNWVMDRTEVDYLRPSNLKFQREQKNELPDSVYDLAADLMHAQKVFPERFPVIGDNESEARMNQAIDSLKAYAVKSSRWEVIQPGVERLCNETIWKIAALMALYRGEQQFGVTDTLAAIYYASNWLKTMIEVSESISESPYSRDLEEMEDFIESQGGTITRAELLHHFRGKVIRTKREIEDRLEYLLDSGRILRTGDSSSMGYKLNV